MRNKDSIQFKYTLEQLFQDYQFNSVGFFESSRLADHSLWTLCVASQLSGNCIVGWSRHSGDDYSHSTNSLGYSQYRGRMFAARRVLRWAKSLESEAHLYDFTRVNEIHSRFCKEGHPCVCMFPRHLHCWRSYPMMRVVKNLWYSVGGEENTPSWRIPKLMTTITCLTILGFTSGGGHLHGSKISSSCLPEAFPFLDQKTFSVV